MFAELINLTDDRVTGALVLIGKGNKYFWSKPGQVPLGELITERSI